jgi:coproporphyrinogen III oxidase-like Fe-S oxidoreductase
LPEDDLVAELYVQAIETLSAAGLMQYEVSNFARVGEESRHNLRYWRRDHYHGFGLGAHSFLGEERFANSRDMQRYLELPVVADFRETLGEDERRREIIFLNLRQVAGIQSEEVVKLCGQEGIEWIDRGLEGGWLQRNGSRVAFTASGFLLSSEYISQLF